MYLSTMETLSTTSSKFSWQCNSSSPCRPRQLIRYVHVPTYNMNCFTFNNNRAETPVQAAIRPKRRSRKSKLIRQCILNMVVLSRKVVPESFHPTPVVFISRSAQQSNQDKPMYYDGEIASFYYSKNGRTKPSDLSNISNWGQIML